MSASSSEVLLVLILDMRSSLGNFICGECRQTFARLSLSYRKHDSGDPDPLQRALDRGSKGLDFVNSPLVMDYLHLKFMGTIPGWFSSSPFRDTIDLGFYSHIPSESGADEKDSDKFTARCRRYSGQLLRLRLCTSKNRACGVVCHSVTLPVFVGNLVIREKKQTK